MHQAEDRKQAELFVELPQHIRAEVAWARTRNIMQKISVFQVQACSCAAVSAVRCLQTCHQAACWQGLPEALRRWSRSAHPTPQVDRAWENLKPVHVHACHQCRSGCVCCWECWLWSGWTELGGADGWHPQPVPHITSWDARESEGMGCWCLFVCMCSPSPILAVLVVQILVRLD